MKNRIVFAFLLITLAACTPVAGPAETPTQPTLSALVAAAKTADALTQAARFPSPPPTVIPITPSPLPTQPVYPVITPDAVQVERWKEYEDALAQNILPMFPSETILCEWDILARTGQEVYVWAVCSSSKGNDSRPAVIHLEADGSVHSVEIPKRGASADVDRMFPKEAKVKFSLYTGNSLFHGRLKEMLNHLNYRKIHPEEPPMIVLSVTLTP
ncbi:MAG: hypothetical protein ACOYYU_04965 [Chloroflexota bacterium]